MTQILEGEKVGVVIRDFDDDGREEAINALPWSRSVQIQMFGRDALGRSGSIFR